MLILNSYKVLNVGAKKCSGLSGLENVCCFVPTWSLKSRASCVRHLHRNQGLCHVFYFPAVCSEETHLPLPILNVFPLQSSVSSVIFSKQGAQAMWIHKSRKEVALLQSLEPFRALGKLQGSVYSPEVQTIA